MKIIDIITLHYPGIQHVMYWETQSDGTPWLNPLDGLIWENKEYPKPTQTDLDQWALEVAPVKYERDQRQKRRNEYPAIGDQLDMIYKAMDSGLLTKVPEFYNAIKVVKDKYPLV